MEMEGKWWVLYEEEPLDIERSRLYDFQAGQVLDGRSGDVLGSYEVGQEITTVTLNDRLGDNTMYQLHLGSTSDEADACTADWTTSGFELYRANWPVPEGETEEEEWDRDDWENEHFGASVTNGFALRDSPALRKVNQQSVLELTDMVH